MPDDADRRRRARASWPIRRLPLGEERDEPIRDATPSELLAMVHRLTLDAWAMSGRTIPDYPRCEAPGKLLRPAP